MYLVKPSRIGGAFGALFLEDSAGRGLHEGAEAGGVGDAPQVSGDEGADLEQRNRQRGPGLEDESDRGFPVRQRRGNWPAAPAGGL